MEIEQSKSIDSLSKSSHLFNELKIILVNIQTGTEIIFPCREALQRDESNFCAEKTFENQPSDDDDESTFTLEIGYFDR